MRYALPRPAIAKIFIINYELIQNMLGSYDGDPNTFSGRSGRITGIIYGSVAASISGAGLYLLGYLPFLNTSVPRLLTGFGQLPLETKAFVGFLAIILIWGLQELVRAFLQPDYSITIRSIGIE